MSAIPPPDVRGYPSVPPPPPDDLGAVPDALAPGQVPWRWPDVLAVLGLSLVGILLLSGGLVLSGWDGSLDDPRFAAVLVLDGTIPAVLALGWLWLRFRPRHRLLWAPDPTRAPRTLVALGLGGLVGLGWYVAVDVISVFSLIVLTGFEPPEVQTEIAQAMATPGAVMVATWLAVAVIAPLGEEIVFRGVLYLGLARSLGPVPAALLSSLVFALVHAQDTLAGTLFLGGYAFAFGLFACWLLHRFGSLWLPIGVHAGANVATLAIASAVGGL